jgi:hypothetical protein
MSKIKKGDFVTVDIVEKRYIYEVTVVNEEKQLASIWIDLPMFGLCNAWIELDRLEKVN